MLGIVKFWFDCMNIQIVSSNEKKRWQTVNKTATEIKTDIETKKHR